jgi:hypothetical protein
LYLYRGFTYVFVNNSTSSTHALEIRLSINGDPYGSGTTPLPVIGSQTGTQTFVVPMNAPNTLYYRSSDYPVMGNTINII